jgi:hypothetical protein
MIPKTIYLTNHHRRSWDDRLIHSLKNTNPDMDIEFYDEERCAIFIEDNYDLKTLDTFNEMMLGPHRADLFRYCVLYKNGGYYVDTDLEPLSDLSVVANGYDLVSSVATYVPVEGKKEPVKFKNKLLKKWTASHIHQGFIASVPGCQVLADLIDHMVQNPDPNDMDGKLYSSFHFYVRYFYEYLLDKMNLDEVSPDVDYELDGIKMRFLKYPFEESENILREGKFTLYDQYRKRR